MTIKFEPGGRTTSVATGDQDCAACSLNMKGLPFLIARNVETGRGVYIHNQQKCRDIMTERDAAPAAISPPAYGSGLYGVGGFNTATGQITLTTAASNLPALAKQYANHGKLDVVPTSTSRGTSCLVIITPI